MIHSTCNAFNDLGSSGTIHKTKRLIRRQMKDSPTAEVPYIGQEYVVMFEFFVSKIMRDSWRSIVHFTMGENAEKLGDRIPAVWINKENHLVIISTVNEEKSHQYIYPNPIEEGKWYKIVVSQKLENDKVLKLYFLFLYVKGSKIQQNIIIFLILILTKLKLCILFNT